MFFPIFWTIYIPIVTIMLVGCGRRVADPCLAPAPARKRGLPVRTGGERSPAINDRGSVAQMRKSFAARQRHLAKALPQVLAILQQFRPSECC